MREGMPAAKAKKKFLGISFKKKESEDTIEDDDDLESDSDSFLPPSYSDSSLKKSAPSAPITRLSPTEHLLRQMAMRYLVDQSLTIKEVASKLKISSRKLGTFFKEEDFMEELNARIERVMGMDSEFRTNQAKISVMHIYEEIRRREVENELKDTPLRDLHKMLIDMQKELRLDTPGEFTSKVGVADLTTLQDRYKKSLSGKLAQKQVKGLRAASEKENVLRLSNRSSEIVEECDEDNENNDEGIE
jgi:hypothetical protein